MQDTRLRLKGTRAIETPVVSRFGTRASRGISREGTLFFRRPEIPKTLLKHENIMSEQEVIFLSRGADLGVNR